MKHQNLNEVVQSLGDPMTSEHAWKVNSDLIQFITKPMKIRDQLR